MNSNWQRGHLLALLILLLGWGSWCVPAIAQTSGSLSGIVQDPQGAAVSGATVTLTDPKKNLTLQGQTSSEGTFAFTTLQPGDYTVTIDAAGFKKAIKSGIIINVNDRQTTGVISLEVGTVGDVSRSRPMPPGCSSRRRAANRAR